MGTASLAQWQAGGERGTHRGHDIFVRRGGDWADAQRPVLLLIHGYPTSSWDYAPIWDALAAHFRLLTADMIGFGWSAKPRDYDYRIADQADLYAELAAQHGIARVHLLAHDYGDTVGQELLARHNEGRGLRLASICWLNGGMFPEVHHARLVQKLLHSPLGGALSALMNERRFRRSFAAVFGPQTRPSDAELADFWALLRHNDGHRLQHKLIRYIGERREHRERWVGAVSDTQVPMRLINGLADPVSGADMAQRYRELVPQADVVGLDGIGHYPQCEDPHEVLSAYLEFVLPLRGQASAA